MPEDGRKEEEGEKAALCYRERREREEEGRRQKVGGWVGVGERESICFVPCLSAPISMPTWLLSVSHVPSSTGRKYTMSSFNMLTQNFCLGQDKKTQGGQVKRQDRTGMGLGLGRSLPSY